MWKLELNTDNDFYLQTATNDNVEHPVVIRFVRLPNTVLPSGVKLSGSTTIDKNSETLIAQ